VLVVSIPIILKHNSNTSITNSIEVPMHNPRNPPIVENNVSASKAAASPI
jgi:hypothetical protein